MFSTERSRPYLIAAAALLIGFGGVRAALGATFAVEPDKAGGSLLAQVTRVGNYETAPASSGIAVPLDAQGHTSLSFKTKASDELVRIIYNAECGVLGSTGAWLSVVITVDGAATDPASSTSFALCTSNGSGSTGTFQWTGAVRQSIYKVPSAGTHAVQVILFGEEDATELWLGDSSLVVDH